MHSLLNPSIRIGVLSDTHLPASPEAHDFLRSLIKDVFKSVDLILHAGDLVSPELLDAFYGYPFHAVRGNMDPASKDIPFKKVIHVREFAIGLIHGWGPVAGLEARVEEEFVGTHINCLVYGHSHRPVCHRHNGILFFNPGSATDRRSMDYHSVGLLEVADEIRGTIIRLDTSY